MGGNVGKNLPREERENSGMEMESNSAFLTKAQDTLREIELTQRLNPDLTTYDEWNYQNRRQMQEILPNIFLGPFGSATKANYEKLKEVGITHIVCIRQAEEARLIRPIFPDRFTYLVLDIADHPTQQIIPFFSQFINDCLQSDGKVLIHGNSGASRSAALLASYIMETHLCTSGEALKVIQAKRFCIFPNEGFRRQLFEYEPILRARLGVPKTERTEKRKERDEGDNSDQDLCDVDL